MVRRMVADAPEWLQPEYMRAALAGERFCFACGDPVWLCRWLGDLTWGLRILHEPASADWLVKSALAMLMGDGEPRMAPRCWGR